MGISVKNLCKAYKDKPLRKPARGLLRIHNKKYALKDISLEIKDGECVGIIGANGSGKSTLLKLICGVTSPSGGEIKTNGRISALLELGAGFNPEYTGISNIYLNGTVMGQSRAETKALIPQICEFADIGDYICKPVKTYSDGMFLRLAFACAISAKPDILIIDEALAVGDFAFRCKCFSKIEELKSNGTTILMVSHDIDAIRRLCQRAIWLDKGTLCADGDVASVSAKYMESMTGNADFTGNPPKSQGACATTRFGSAVGSVISVDFPKIQQTDKKSCLICHIEIPEGTRLDTLAVSVSFKNSFGLDLTVMSTADNGTKFLKHGRTAVKFEYVCQLCRGEYSVCVSLEDRGTTPIKYYDFADGIGSFEVISDHEYFGTFHTPTEMSVYEEK